jgi:hypothetical protein
LIPGAARALGPLPSAPPKPPAASALDPVAVAPSGIAAEPAMEPVRPVAPAGAAEPAPVAVEAPNVAPFASGALRSGPKPALLAAAAVGAIALGAAALILNGPPETETASGQRSATDLAAAAPAPGSSLPSERADPLPPEALRTVTQTTAAAAAETSRARGAAPARVPSAPVVYADLNRGGDAVPARRADPFAAPVATVVAVPPSVVEVVAPPPAIQASAPRPIPAEVARARPPVDPDAPFATAPAGLRLNDPDQ